MLFTGPVAPGTTSAGPLDLMICATAAHHELIVLHDDADFVTAARFLPDVSERNVRNAPGLQHRG